MYQSVRVNGSVSNGTYLSRSRRPREDSDLGLPSTIEVIIAEWLVITAINQSIHTVKPLLQVMSCVALDYLLRGDDRLK